MVMTQWHDFCFLRMSEHQSTQHDGKIGPNACAGVGSDDEEKEDKIQISTILLFPVFSWCGRGFFCLCLLGLFRLF
jgi:hypothetical protein